MRYSPLFFIVMVVFVLMFSLAQARLPFTLRSSALSPTGAIPLQYTHNLAGCPGGNNVNPPLEIISRPSGTGSFVLIMDDVGVADDSEDGEEEDGSNFVHWAVWNIPPTTTTIPEGWMPPPEVVQGMNGFSISEGMAQTGYGGPCPPAGESHRYVFYLFALSESSVDLISLADTSDEGDGNGIISVQEVQEAGDDGAFTILSEIVLSGEYPGVAPGCGNGWIEEGEQCDDDNLDENTCTTIPGGFTGGTLRCNVATCEFDTSGCVIEILPGSVSQGGACTEDVQCVQDLSCVVRECRNVGGVIDAIKGIIDNDGLSKRRIIVRIAVELRNFLS